MTAHEALTALLTAQHAVDRVTAYGLLLDLVPIDVAVIWDDRCNRAFPLNSFFKHLVDDATIRREHTPGNCSWFQLVETDPL